MKTVSEYHKNLLRCIGARESINHTTDLIPVMGQRYWDVVAQYLPHPELELVCQSEWEKGMDIARRANEGDEEADRELRQEILIPEYESVFRTFILREGVDDEFPDIIRSTWSSSREVFGDETYFFLIFFEPYPGSRMDFEVYPPTEENDHFTIVRDWDGDRSDKWKIEVTLGHVVTKITPIF